MSQEQTKRQGGGGGDDDDGNGRRGPARAAREARRGRRHLLDEIDAVLEENAEDFVRAYVQKGGQ